MNSKFTQSVMLLALIAALSLSAAAYVTDQDEGWVGDIWGNTGANELYSTAIATAPEYMDGDLFVRAEMNSLTTYASNSDSDPNFASVYCHAYEVYENDSSSDPLPVIAGYASAWTADIEIVFSSWSN